MKSGADASALDLTETPSKLADWLVLSKPRIASMSLVVTFAGFYMASQGALDAVRLFHVLLGTTLVASGSSALNHFLERDYDGLMERTSDRPLVTGRLRPGPVVIAGSASATLGTAYLAVAATPLAAVAAAFTCILYVFIYTPLKRVTTLNTAIGAVPGALPILIGWTGATGNLNIQGLVLFSILYLWQLPHFFAIAWMYREENERAGFKMLPTDDPDGTRTSRQILIQALALLFISVLPSYMGMTGQIYLIGAIVLGFAYSAVGGIVSLRRTRSSARSLVLTSVAYLPLLLLLMMLDKV